jgi:hypothetical protein
MPRRNRLDRRPEPQVTAAKALENELRAEWVRHRPASQWDPFRGRLIA